MARVYPIDNAFAEAPPHPKFADANFDLSPQAGRGVQRAAGSL